MSEIKRDNETVGGIGANMKFTNYTIDELIDFNPSESIKKDSLAKKISMEKLLPFTRKITGFEIVPYSSGPKFRNGDTLLAKITPCLENGKTAFVDILEDDEVAFGSSEFIVLREKKEISDKEFIYYLAKSPVFRQKAISCMEGTSGRKRVNDKILKQQVLPIPDIDGQRKIASILSSLDKKIAFNSKLNDNLEAMAKTLYDYWFVQFDFPDENGKPYKSSGGKMIWNEKLKREIPEGWIDSTLQDFLIIKNGKDHKHLSNGTFPVYGSGGVMRYADSYLYDKESVLIPRKGSLNNIMYINEPFWSVDTMFYSEMRKEYVAKYVYYSIKDFDFSSLDTGTGVPSMTSSILYNLKLIKPNDIVLLRFDSILKDFFATIYKLNKNSELLIDIRDWLLPMLMNGQVSVNYHLADD
ncbi:type I restriction endonuclease subunit S [Bacteroidia bacterium]|nr:type I restriction endonuclease subunit S [Bacteroidia bacterium]